MDNRRLKGLTDLKKATNYSLSGLLSAWKHESAFRTECVLTIIMIPAGLWIGNTLIQRLLLVTSCLVVLTVELLNSAIEAIVDRIGREFDPMSKKAKDMGSAAVFVSLIITLIIWLAIIFENWL